MTSGASKWTCKTAMLGMTALLACLLALTDSIGAAHSENKALAPQRLFRIVNTETTDLNPEQIKALERIKKLPSTAAPKEVAVAKFQDSVLSDATVPRLLMLPLNKTKELSMEDYQVAPAGEDRKVLEWKGKEDDESVILSASGKSVTGLIYSANKVYSVEPLGKGLHAIVQIDQTKFLNDHIKETSPHEKKVDKDGLDRNKLSLPTAKTPAVIRVLVAYTPKVEELRNGGLDSLITGSIDLTNASYLHSQIHLRLELAHSVKVDYKESSDIDQDLAWFQANNEVRKLRKTYNADVCVLLINSDDAQTGSSAAVLADKDHAFSVVEHDAAVRFLSFPHEIGHLQGARHDPDWDHTVDTVYPYDHGYVNPQGGWVTIMAYPSKDNPTRISYWSNPNVKYPPGASGKPTGTTTDHNNARVLNETAGTVSAFHP